MTGAEKKHCLDCGATYFNRHAHLEECPGKIREFTGWYSCGCPGHGWGRDGGRCVNQRERRPVFRPVEKSA